LAADHGAVEALRLYLVAMIDPFGSLWFIYLLPIFFVTVRLLRRAPPLLVWLAAAALEVAPIETTWVVIDEFAARFVYFYSGYLLMAYVMRFAEAAGSHAGRALLFVMLSAIVNGAFVLSGYADLAFVSLVLGYLGAAALIAASVLLAQRQWLQALRYCGQHSLAIYLSFFLPVAIARTASLRFGVVTDIGTISLLVTIAGVLGAVLIYRLLRGGKTRFLFERPDRFRLAPTLELAPQR
jgi:uncharacterized membrane protein YcfT